VELTQHDENGTTFEKLLKKYDLQSDVALARMARVVAAGVDYMLHDRWPSRDDPYGVLALGLLAVSDGMVQIQPTDAAVLSASFATYDALYQYLKSLGPDEKHGSPLEHLKEVMARVAQRRAAGWPA
jgi:hypothetical protein